LVLASPDRDGRPVVLAVDSLTPSQRLALVRPAELLAARGVPVVVVCGFEPGDELVALGVQSVGRLATVDRCSWSALGLAPPRAVFAAGGYMAVGRLGWELAAVFAAPYLVIQHGVITPYAPPLDPGAHLLAWTEADARFWTTDRNDVTSSVVGSQCLWEAGRSHAMPQSDAPLCFLGQLHGIELGRSTTRRTVGALRHETPSFLYRPHPSERDWRSRRQHRTWRRQGVAFANPGRPLLEMGSPVAAIFSTGILEAAAAGLPAFGVCTRPPPWVGELWDRYGIERWGGNGTTRVDVPLAEPAGLVADAVEALG